MKEIRAQMVRDWVPPYGMDTIPMVVYSDHPRFVPGTRFDWGFVKIALSGGYSIHIEPMKPL